MAKAQPNAVVPPNLGLYLGGSPLNTPNRAFQDGDNFRIKNGIVTNRNMGFTLYSNLTFNGPIMLFENVFTRNGISKFIVATDKDLYDYNESADTAVFITPTYVVGTVDVAGTTITAASGAPNWLTNGIKNGDQIFIGSNSQHSISATYHTITNVTNGVLTVATPPGNTLGAQYTIRRVLTGDLEHPAQSTTFVLPDDGVGDDLWFFTNAVDPIITWDMQAASTLRHDDLQFTCANVAVFKNMMIYADITQAGDQQAQSFINSDVGKPLNAGALGTGLAGQFRAHDDIDPIWVLTILGDNLAIMSERHVTQVQFVGDPLIFIFRDAATGVGPLTSRNYGNFGDYVEFTGADSQYLFDGVSITEVGKQLWREVLRLRDPARPHAAFTHFNEEEGELYWICPLTSDAGVGDTAKSAEKAFTEHYLEEVGDRVPTPFSKRSLPFCASGYSRNIGVLTWDQITGLWKDQTFRWNDIQLFSAFAVNIFGDTDGKLWIINSAQTDRAGAQFSPSFVKTGRKPTHDGRMRGLIRRIYPFVSELPGTLSVTLRLFDGAQQDPQTSETFTYTQTVGEGGHFITTFRRCRYFEMDFGSNTNAWEMSGYDYDLTPGGRR